MRGGVSSGSGVHHYPTSKRGAWAEISSLSDDNAKQTYARHQSTLRQKSVQEPSSTPSETCAVKSQRDSSSARASAHVHGYREKENATLDANISSPNMMAGCVSELADSETLSLLASIVGDGVDRKVLGLLLADCEGKVEVAAHRYFESDGEVLRRFDRKRPLASDVNVASESTRPHKRANVERSPDVTRTISANAAGKQAGIDLTASHAHDGSSNGDQGMFVGEFVTVGYSTTVHPTRLNAGDDISVERASVVPQQTTASAGRPHGRQKTQPESFVIRFVSKGSEIGRLPADISRWMAVLMDAGIVFLEGVCVDAPPRLSLMCDVILQLKAYLRRGAFAEAPRMPNGAQAPAAEPTKEAEEKAQKLSQAVQKLLDLVGLVPTKSLLRSRRGGEVDVADGAGNNNGGNVGTIASSDVDLSALYLRAQKYDASLPEVTPSALLTTQLRPYQKQGLGWILHREGVDIGAGRGNGSFSLEGESKDNAIHPLWEEFVCGGRDDGAQTHFYFSPYNGALRLSFPSAAEASKGGILADDMGLGKTVQILSLVVTNPSPVTLISWRTGSQPVAKGTRQPRLSFSRATLIVCPLSLLAQWRDEIELHTGLKSNAVLVYYGADGNKGTLNFATAAEIVLTTYGTVSSEYSRCGTAFEPGSSQAPTGLFSVHFHRVVLDEAQSIKARDSAVSRACRQLSADSRWAVTGTPVQNSLDDLHTLVSFLRAEPWSSTAFWNASIARPLERRDPAALDALQAVMQSLLLRRTKDQKAADGRPLVELPPRDIRIVRIPFGKGEADFYDAIYSRSRTRFSEYCAAGTILSNYANILELLLRLRQACDHPFLLNPRIMAEREGGSAGGKAPGQRSASRAVFSDIDELVSMFVSGSSQLQMAPAFVDAARRTIASLKEDALSDARGDRSVLADGGGDGAEGGAVECVMCLDPPECPVVLPCLHVGCRECMHAIVERLGVCPICRTAVTVDELADLDSIRSKSEKASAAAGGSPPPQTTPTLTVGSGAGDVAWRKSRLLSSGWGASVWKSSAKIDALISDLRECGVGKNAKTSPDALRDDGQPHKCVVFSQWTSMLDLVEHALAMEEVVFLRLDGSLSQAERERVIEKFTCGTEAHVFLVSLRSGGVGLNLTAATRIFVLDPWFNSAVENQAINRVHRIGQSRPVVVHRYVVAGTVEERMLLLQDKKDGVADDAFGTSEQRQRDRIEDLRSLFEL
eukprot:Opistho-2@53784